MYMYLLGPQKWGSFFCLAVTNITFASLRNFESPSTPLNNIDLVLGGCQSETRLQKPWFFPT